MMMMGFDLERGWSPGEGGGNNDCPQTEKWAFWVLDANIAPEHF